MRETIRKVAFAALAAVLLAASPSLAWGHGGGGHGGGFHGGGSHGHGFGFRDPVFGPGFWWGSAYPWSWYYPPPPYYWYYCPSAGAYYPNVQTCPEPWVTLPTGAE
ncbi:MAG TPA: hypothetical protein VKM54_25355 [Myxococcota bacterium]|nr:hypothetical protein [Myxococcota bacterium]